jgi:hypothetical protein
MDKLQTPSDCECYTPSSDMSFCRYFSSSFSCLEFTGYNFRHSLASFGWFSLDEADGDYKISTVYVICYYMTLHKYILNIIRSTLISPDKQDCKASSFVYIHICKLSNFSAIVCRTAKYTKRIYFSILYRKCKADYFYIWRLFDYRNNCKLSPREIWLAVSMKALFYLMSSHADDFRECSPSIFRVEK